MTSLNPEIGNICHSLQQGSFCYVLGHFSVRPPSSLCLHTRDEMDKRGYRSVVISTEALSIEALKSQTWDRVLIERVWFELQSQSMAQLHQWLETTQTLSPEQRLIQFTNDFLLTELCEQPTVFFLDSVDVLLDFPQVTDALLAWIEHCCELRDTYLTYHHLSFAVFGTAERFRTAIGNSRLLAAQTEGTLSVKIFADFETPTVKKNVEKIEKKPYSWETMASRSLLMAC